MSMFVYSGLGLVWKEGRGGEGEGEIMREERGERGGWREGGGKMCHILQD